VKKARRKTILRGGASKRPEPRRGKWQFITRAEARRRAERRPAAFGLYPMDKPMQTPRSMLSKAA